MRKRTPRRLSHHHQSRSGNPISAPNHFLLRQTKAQDRALLFATTTVLPGHLERFWLDVIELFCNSSPLIHPCSDLDVVCNRKLHLDLLWDRTGDDGRNGIIFTIVIIIPCRSCFLVNVCCDSQGLLCRDNGLLPAFSRPFVRRWSVMHCVRCSPCI